MTAISGLISPQPFFDNRRQIATNRATFAPPGSVCCGVRAPCGIGQDALGLGSSLVRRQGSKAPEGQPSRRRRSARPARYCTTKDLLPVGVTIRPKPGSALSK